MKYFVTIEIEAVGDIRLTHKQDFAAEIREYVNEHLLASDCYVAGDGGSISADKVSVNKLAVYRVMADDLEPGDQELGIFATRQAAREAVRGFCDDGMFSPDQFQIEKIKVETGK